VCGRYTYDSEPSSKRRQHAIQVVLDPPKQFSLTVDSVPLALHDGGDWEFDPKGKLGFMTELVPFPWWILRFNLNIETTFMTEVRRFRRSWPKL
jgi:hypothetical protein